LDKKYPVDAKTMHLFIGLSIHGDDLVKALKYKDATNDDIYAKYSTHRGTHVMVIIDIND